MLYTLVLIGIISFLFFLLSDPIVYKDTSLEERFRKSLLDVIIFYSMVFFVVLCLFAFRCARTTYLRFLVWGNGTG